MELTSKIYVAGHRGMVGSAIMKNLKQRGFTNIVVRNSMELDLRCQDRVSMFFKDEKPEYVILAAGKVGGIGANIESPGDFLYDNVMIFSNIIHQSHIHSVKKILVIGSSCIYPRESMQPMKEEYLMDGKLEPTNEGFAISKIVALKMGEYYRAQYGLNAISVMPCNLYGDNDSFDPAHSHVLSATVKKIVDAIDEGKTEIPMWGSGQARREFMNVDDMAECCLFMMDNYEQSGFINIGVGYDISIKELTEMVARIAGYKGTFIWDATRPDGMLKKCLDITRMRELGFEPKITLENGVAQMIKYYDEIKKKI